MTSAVRTWQYLRHLPFFQYSFMKFEAFAAFDAFAELAIFAQVYTGNFITCDYQNEKETHF